MDQPALPQGLGGLSTPLMESPFIAEDPRRKRDLDQLRLLAIFYFVWAGLMLLSIGFLVFHYVIMQTVFRSPEFLKTQGNAPFSPHDLMRLFIVFYVLAGTLLVIGSALNVASGLFLLRRKYRVFSIVIGALDCLMVPLGTALGVFTLIILSRESVIERYREVK